MCDQREVGWIIEVRLDERSSSAGTREDLREDLARLSLRGPRDSLGPPPEHPVVPRNRLMLDTNGAAEFLGLEEAEFRRLAASGEFPRSNCASKTYRYYVYDLLDWHLAKRV